MQEEGWGHHEPGGTSMSDYGDIGKGIAELLKVAIPLAAIGLLAIVYWIIVGLIWLWNHVSVQP